MNTKNFQDYLEHRLGTDEAHKIEHHAHLEKKFLTSLQNDIKSILIFYQNKYKLDQNELAQRINAHPQFLTDLQKGTVDLTLGQIAHICASLELQPQLEFTKHP